MNLLQFGGFNINDGSEYLAFLASPGLGVVPVSSNEIGADGTFPSIESISRQGRFLKVEILIKSSTPTSARLLLNHIFETESGNAKSLTAVNDVGITVYVDAVCLALTEKENSPLIFEAVLKTQRDPYWKEFNAQTSNNTITTDGQQFSISIDSDQIVRPTFLLTPTTAKSGTNAFKRFIAVKWNSPQSASNYAVDITNGALDTTVATTNFASTTGADIRLQLNGNFIDFWLNGINSSATSVWAILNFQPTIPLTINGSLPASGTIENIDFNESISSLPESGLILIDSEIFTYSGKNEVLKRIFITNRATKNTSEASHSDATSAHWIQHNLEILFGDSTLSAYVPDPTREPIIDRANSDNSEWKYLLFGNNGTLRPGGWTKPPEQVLQYTGYSRNHFLLLDSGGWPYNTDPWEQAGVSFSTAASAPYVDLFWENYFPCGITEWVSNGEIYGAVTTPLQIGVFLIDYQPLGSTYWDSVGGEVPTGASWASFSDTITTLFTEPATRIRFGYPFYNQQNWPNQPRYGAELDDALVTFEPTWIPTTYIAPESGNYNITGTLIHVQLGKSLQINYTTRLNDTLEIDTEIFKVTDQSDNSSQFQAVNVIPPSIDWLPMVRGLNTFQWDESDIVEMDLDVVYKRRYGH